MKLKVTIQIESKVVKSRKETARVLADSTSLKKATCGACKIRFRDLYDLIAARHSTVLSCRVNIPVKLLTKNKHLSIMSVIQTKGTVQISTEKAKGRNEVNGLPYENIRCDYVPCVAYVYPERNSEYLDEGHSSQTDCPDLFIPDFTRAKAFIENDRWPGNEEFTLTLTDESGKRLLAFALREVFLLSA
ncbi:unnamed protein product, partial [Litomosoides sigmodontis]